MIAAIDFDGTLVENKWPAIGEPKENLVKFVKQLVRDGWKIILWTCRCNKQLDDALQFCYERLGLRFDAVNENLPETIKLYGTNPRKISANLYIDDRSYMQVLDLKLVQRSLECK